MTRGRRPQPSFDTMADLLGYPPIVRLPNGGIGRNPERFKALSDLLLRYLSEAGNTDMRVGQLLAYITRLLHPDWVGDIVWDVEDDMLVLVLRRVIEDGESVEGACQAVGLEYGHYYPYALDYEGR